jgi:hypothetical protein
LLYLERLRNAARALAAPDKGAGLGDPLGSDHRARAQDHSASLRGQPQQTHRRILGISHKAVETHRATIKRKIGGNSIADIVRYAMRNNIIQA